MSLRRITAAEAIEGLAGFDHILDARSPSEHAEDHLPGAESWPVLDDAQRALIGTEYAQISPFDARKRGAALVSTNIARLVETRVMDKPREWRPLVYCWRGGQRSGALAAVLDQIGFRTSVLEGGYREFRRAVLAELAALPQGLDLRVLCGRTGSAKSRLLQALAAEGAQVLDLEALACHRGSVLGPLPDRPQPSQKAFETAVWRSLRALSAERPVFVEGESRTIGRLRVPEALLERMRAARCVSVEMPVPARVRFLVDDYAHFLGAVELFCERIGALREVRGADTVAQWQALARAGEVDAVVQALLEQHYDPVYTKSMHRHFTQLGQASVLDLPDAAPATLQAAARRLLAAA